MIGAMSTFDAKAFLEKVTTEPGVYQMLNRQEKVIYIGKARNLKKRLTSYFRRNLLDPKTVSLVQNIVDVKVVITRSDNEALLLESELIKKFKPHYNVLLKDDKSYPYIYLSGHSQFPSMTFYRGAKKQKGEYFGPYPSAGAVRETLLLIQKLFKLRQCSDTFFTHRKRPCLQYFIKRCTAPCVNYISENNYKRDVTLAKMFLKGDCEKVITKLGERMSEASDTQHYELAAQYRDQIVKLRKIQQREFLVNQSGEADIVAVKTKMNQACICVLYVRGGRLLGNKIFFPKVPEGAEEAEVLESFLSQYYLSPLRGEVFPKKIILNAKIPEQAWFSKAFKEHVGRSVVITTTARNHYRQWLKLAGVNATHSLDTHVNDKMQYYQRLVHVQNALKLNALPQRVECFDISHTMGAETVASCVVFNEEGPHKKDYRRFNIKDAKKSDDYGALKLALTRHYKRLKEREDLLPDVLMIDGGKGQLNVAMNVLEELQVSGVTLLGIAKGEGRKAGLEKIYVVGRKVPLELAADSPALHFLQHIRDEAHRFAITGHRKKRAKAASRSSLEDIPGVGAKRKRALLHHFGGLQELRRASVEDIAKVPGISKAIAQKIYDLLR